MGSRPWHKTAAGRRELARAVKLARMQLFVAHRANPMRMRDQERLYNRLMRSVSKIADMTGMLDDDVLDQVMDEARANGALAPVPGKDF